MFEVIRKSLKGYISGTYAKALLKGSCNGTAWLREMPGMDARQILVTLDGADPFITRKSQQILSGTVMRTQYE